MRDFSFDLMDICAPGVKALKPYEPGKPISELQREFGVRDVIKLASNENPLGPSPKALAAVRAALAGLAIYPDGKAHELRQALAAKHHIDPACITLGNGSEQNLEFIARAFLEPGKNAVFSRYAFAVYPIVTQAVGAVARVAEACAPEHPTTPYGHDLEQLRAAIDADTRVVFIANPNNPTGTWLAARDLRRFLEQVPPRVLVVVDEAYLEYVNEAEYPDCGQWLGEFPNLVVTRTFSKIYGLAGLRCGYSLSHARVAELLNRLRAAFNVSNLSQAGALAALSDQAHVRLSTELNRSGQVQLQAGFRTLGLKWIPSIANFLTVDFVKPASAMYTALLHQGIIVRPLVNYGLPNHLRITIGLPEQNERLLLALERALTA
ncbi:MAG: histidinol-phosphate transaminase [Gammaproteobacteria bacterium]|nr:histidinol-phosphate transaminase [Gammaproteobacteria bacterium]MBU6508685.1 histidinol-phosphate transaminase [Gammaproteobacteria bacterium]MDE1982960.1 histidinol-phosphate transaminase [Gammaproteobacteria bacterium]MDE2107780.1 histidinol-phosphate transaminase [Gammaproteobacteria bacterium]MDE2459694.1 histidinol-phosphate transaminase [Gammaproteobacteria bacterium]